MNIKLKPNSILGPIGTSFIVDTALTPHKGSIKLRGQSCFYCNLPNTFPLAAV